MNRSRLVPFALLAGLTLAACSGESAPAPTGYDALGTADDILADLNVDIDHDGPQHLGGSATVIVDGVTYEFFTDVGMGCRELFRTLTVDMPIATSDGVEVEGREGNLSIQLPKPEADESLQGSESVRLRIPEGDGGTTFVAGEEPFSDLEVTLTVGDNAAHGEQVLEHIAGNFDPITAHIDVACTVID